MTIKFLIAFLVLALLASLIGCSNSSVSTIGELTLVGPAVTLNLPTGLATDSTGNLYIFDSGSHRVLKFDKEGNFILEWGGQGSEEGKFNCYEDKGTICGIAIDAQDNLYVVDKGNYRIQKFDGEGNFLLTWGGQGTEDGQFIRPIYVAIDSQNNVFVTDDRNPVIQKFDSNGQFLGKWGSFGEAEGQFRHATGIAVDSEGNVYVADYENRRIQKFDNDGQFLLAWETGNGGQSGVPEAIAVDGDDRIFVTDSDLKQVEIFDQNGATLNVVDLQGVGIFNRISPYGIAVDISGNLYISDRQNNRVMKYMVPLWE